RRDFVNRIREHRDRAEKARGETRTANDRLDVLQSELTALHEKKIAALAEAELKGREAAARLKELEKLQSPFSPHSLSVWSITHGVKIIISFIALFLLHRFIRMISHYIVYIFISTGDRNISPEEWENRKQTLSQVFSTTARVV